VKRLRVILNGRGAGNPRVRTAVRQMCEEGQTGIATPVSGRERRDLRSRAALAARCPAAASSRQVTYA
jgi:hypothetical protein